MTDPVPPPWLASWQQAFAEALTAPLKVVEGQRQPDADSIPDHVSASIHGPNERVRLSAEQRFAVYQSQYWMRLLNTFQVALPRVTKVVGPWTLNDLATIHLLDHPPSTADLDGVVDGFPEKLAASIARLDPAPLRCHGSLASTRPSPPATATERRLAQVDRPVALLAQALRADVARRRIGRVSVPRPWTPTAEEQARLLSHRLQVADGVVLLRFDYDLADPKEASHARLPHPQHWVFWRSASGPARRQVSAVWARVLSEAHRRPLGEALDVVADVATPDQVRELESGLSDWVHVAVTSRWWVGLAGDQRVAR